MLDAVCISKQWSSSSNCELLMRNAPYPLRYERPKKLILDGSKLRSHFRHLWTKVHQIWLALRMVIAVCKTVFRSTICCSNLEIFAIKS